MKKSIALIVTAFISFAASAQFVATVELKEDIPGICNSKEVYALFPMLTGQVEAACSLTKPQIEEKLNTDLTFLKENPKFKGEGMIAVYINCSGEMVLCKIDKSTKNDELDKQILETFKNLTGWKSGSLNGKDVDSILLFSFEIKKGKLIF